MRLSENMHPQGRMRMISNFQDSFRLHRELISRRLVVLLLLLYLSALVDIGHIILGDLRTGFYYGNYGYVLFPFPSNPSFLLPVITPVPLIEAIIYTIFIYQGIWIAWSLLGILYIMMPLLLRLYRIRKGTAAAPRLEEKEKRTRLGIITGMLAFLSIVFSVGTFSIENNLHSYGPMPFLVAIGISALLVGVMFQDS